MHEQTAGGVMMSDEGVKIEIHGTQPEDKTYIVKRIVVVKVGNLGDVCCELLDYLRWKLDLIDFLYLSLGRSPVKAWQFNYFNDLLRGHICFDSKHGWPRIVAIPKESLLPSGYNVFEQLQRA
jgi:hypothetical protein